MGKPLDPVIQAAKSLYPKITTQLSRVSAKKYKNDEWTLEELDNWRNSTLPATLKSRYDNKKLKLSKDELVLIMDWKLAKGKFRPTLPKLIKSNDEESVETITSAGFSIFMEFVELAKDDWLNTTLLAYQEVVKASLKKLCELRGVGPATGSLLMSLLNASTSLAPPFFSDEAFMYFIQEPFHPGSAVKYNVKEYIDEYVGTLYNIRASNPSVSMDELEKGGWSLKMYDLHRITLLADCKLDFTVSDDDLVKFSDSSKYLPEPTTRKRKAGTREVAADKKPSKRAKKSSSS